MKFDIDAARGAGYSDDEIAGYLATENKFDLEGALKSGYTASDVVGFLAKPPSAEPAAASSAPVEKDQRGLIQRVGEFFKPEYKSVLETQAPTAQQEQADVNRRASLGVGPISKETAAQADLVRSGMAKPKSEIVSRTAAAMDQAATPTFGDLVERAKQPESVRAATEAKANEFRSAGEWALDAMSNLGQGFTTIAQLPTNIISPSSAFAGSLREMQKELQDQESDVNKAKRAVLKDRVQNESGFLGKYAATVGGLVTDPTLALSEAIKQVPMFLGVLGAAKVTSAAVGGGVQLAGRVSPTLALGEAISGGAIQAGARSAGATAGGAGASVLMTSGDAAGAVYERLTDRNQTPIKVWEKNPDYQKLISEGKTSKEAIEEIATSKSQLAAIVTAPLGLFGFMGAEASIVSRGAATTAAEALTAKGAAKIFGKDLIGEQIEEGGTQFGGNVITRTVDKNQQLLEGVPEAMGTAAVTSAPYSAAAVRGEYLAGQQKLPEDLAAQQAAVNALSPYNNAPATQMTNFTPADSPTKAAGLVDVVVPVPVAAPAVAPLAEVQINPQTEQQFGLDKLRLGTTNVGVPSTVGTTNVPSGAGGGVADLGSLGTTGPSVVGPTGGVAPTAATTELGGGQAAPIGATASEQPATLKQEWYGRRGDGYLTKPDAEQALAGRARMFPDLEWKVDQLPTGKFRLAGYETATPQETTLGTQTTQAFQAAQEEQQAPTFGATAPTIAATAPDVQGAQPAAVGLKLAPAASMRVISSVRKELIKQNVEIAPVPQAEMNESQQVASAVANMLGKTLTVVRYESGDQSAMPNGMIDRLGGNNIFVANDTEDSPLFVVMHEAHHGLPEESRIKLNTALNSLFKEEMRGEFSREFNYTEDQLDEEIPAFMVQAISKRADFWEQLRAKMGNKDFAEVAKQILSKLNEIITGSRKEYGNDFVTKYIKDVEKARDLLTTAYAEAINNKAAAPEAKQVAPVTGPVAKEEVVVDGVMFSSRSRNLVELPTIDFKDLLGKRVFGIKADLTDAGVSYTGIDGSQLEFPIEMMGGPNFVALPENVKSNVVWAVRGGATLTKIMKVVNDSDYIIVHAMNSNSHLTNATISQAYIQTVEAYLKDNRISRENLLALDKIVRSPANKNSLPDFVGFESPDIIEYIDGLSFDQRGALAKMLEKKEAQIHGLPNIERFRRETIDPEYAGYRQGDAMLVIEIDKENPTVKLGEEGTKMHPSYPLGLRGKVVGKLSKGINYELIYRDYFENKVPTLGNKEAGAWYTFDRVMPVQEITPEIAASVSEGGYKAIKSARQAEASLALANDNWLVSGKTKADGGVSVQEFVDALASNDGAAALTMYTPEQVKAGIKDKSFSVYQLGKQGGDKGLQVFFGLKRGAPWYKDMIEGVSDNEVEVVSVTNNETGAQGVGIPAIITKAIQEGATILDAFAVKSKRFPDGFLPEMYAQFGFETIGSIPFDASYYDANQMADLKKFWADGGWKESDGYPDVVVMKWKGNDDERATSIERYVREGQTSISLGVPEYTRASAGKSGEQRDTSRGSKGRARGTDGGQVGGDQGVGNAAPVVRRAYDSIQELATLSDGDIRNLGLDPAEVAKLKQSLGGIQFSKRAGSPEPIGRSSIGRDKGDSAKVEGAIHYGRSAGLSVLSGTSFGSGIKGAEQARLSGVGVDPRIKRRVYFYLPMVGGIPQPEIGLGTNVYTANLSNLYDPSVGARKFPTTPNEFESAVLDAGFRGYINRAQGTAVVLNSDVPVKAMGKSSEQAMVQRKPQMVAEKISTRVEGQERVRKPTNEQMISIIKARPELAKVAPSFRLEFGSARVNFDEVAAADEALAKAGSTFQFNEDTDGQVEVDLQFSRRTKPDPKKTVIAYKLFRVEKDRPGELFPLFVPVWGDGGPQKFSARDPRRHGEGLPIGEWYDAEVGENAPSTKTGKPQVKSKLGGLAFRPGWHAGDLPIATHIGSKSDPSLNAPDLRSTNQVWAEVEMPNDVDWQTEAEKRGINAKGKFIAKEAHITDQLPEDGFYRYKTNSNMTGSWLIGGSMKVTRILSDEEVKSINDAAGTADLPRGEKFDAKKYGFEGVMKSNRSIGEALQERINEDIEQVIGEYEDIKGTDGGRILDTDMVRELSPEYRADRSRAAEVHEASSFLTQAMFDSRIANNDAGIVAFMAGGGGAGKSTANELVGNMLNKAHTVLDGTLSSYDKAKRNVESALKAGNKVRIVYVYREPVEAMRNGVLTRAERMGRTVTIDALVKGHAGSSSVVRKLQEEFGDNPMFKLIVVDNSRGQGNAKIANLSDITPVIQSGLKERLQNATESEFQKGRIGEAVYRATTASYPDARRSDQAGLGGEAVRRGAQVGVQGRAGSEQLQLSLIKLFTELRGARGLKLARVQEQVENNPLSAAIKNVEENFYDIVGQLEEDGLIKINCK